MRVGLNLLYLVPGETGGMEVYARELIPWLRRLAPKLELVAFVNREAAEAGGGPWDDLIPSVTVPVNARNRFEWVRGEQQLLPPRARKEGVDVLHSLASTGPGWGRFRRVVTIHDLIYRLYPEAHFGVLTLGMRVVVPLAARRSHRVIAVSENTRDDLVRLLGVSPEKIDVVPQGHGSKEGAPEPLPEIALRAKYMLGDRPIVFSPSAKRPVKNIARLLDALALIPADERPVTLLPGYETPYEAELRAHASRLGLEHDVRFLGWVAAAEIEGMYAAADAFVFPSLYEGFGAPVLEAMSRGVPVACSSRGSLSEVSGGAALHFDPESPTEIADAIKRLVEDGPLADRLRAAGERQAAEYTWERTVWGTLASYERALGRMPLA